MSTQPSTELETCSADAELLGSYVLVSELASGHLTTLHRAHAAGSSGAALVIKRLRYQHVHELADRELLLAAGRAGMRVHSPHVVRVLAVHEDPEPFMVMEHVDGVTLSTLLEETLDQEVLRYVFPILVDVLEGLEVLHGLHDAGGGAASLVHGAPSARHVLVGYDGVARLFDLTHATGPGFRVAARRSQRLQPAEMAPEQLLAPTHVDARCDLFIVGTVLFRALTGQPLFQHESRDEALQQLLRKPILSPSEAGSTLGAGFDRICARALARARADRYASAAEMARDLKAEAERARLYASRDEIGALVRMAALSTHEGDEVPPELMHPSRPSDAGPPPPAEDSAPPDAGDALSLHHQGSSSFGFLGGVIPARAPASPGATTAPALREAQPSRASGSRDSGAWYEGLPSIFPQREEPRSSAPFWWSAGAAALALIGSLLIDPPPWQTSKQSVREQPPVPKLVQRESAPPPPGTGSYLEYFSAPRSTVVSSALPPRGSDAPQSCQPTRESADAHAVNTVAPAALDAKPKVRRVLDALPPNPY